MEKIDTSKSGKTTYNAKPLPTNAFVAAKHHLYRCNNGLKLSEVRLTVPDDQSMSLYSADLAVDKYEFQDAELRSLLTSMSILTVYDPSKHAEPRLTGSERTFKPGDYVLGCYFCNGVSSFPNFHSALADKSFAMQCHDKNHHLPQVCDKYVIATNRKEKSKWCGKCVRSDYGLTTPSCNGMSNTDLYRRSSYFVSSTLSAHPTGEISRIT